MSWNLEEALQYYRTQGAPGDQAALIALLREIQQECGSIPADVPEQIAQFYGIRQTLVLALIRRIPSLRLAASVLEICAGPRCGKCANLVDYAQEIAPKGVTVTPTGCMRLCGKGPNIRWNGTLYHRADRELLRRLLHSQD